MQLLLLLACTPSTPPTLPVVAIAETADTGALPTIGSPLPELACVAEVTVPGGRLCALRPSDLFPEARDVYGTATPQDQRIGFGYHVVALPTTPLPGTPLWVHFGGTYGRPYDQDQDTFASSLWLGELLQAGYTVIQPAYANRFSINDSCEAAPGVDVDDCAGLAREEVLTGTDVSGQREVPPADSVDLRLSQLIERLREVGALPYSNGSPDWPTTRVSGHSQGGNLAYYVARFRGVQFACMLASPYDLPDTVAPSFPPIADWFKRGSPLTVPPALGQVVVRQDRSATAFIGAGRQIGLTEGVDQLLVDRPDLTEDEAHAAPLADATLAVQRAEACLE